MCFRLHYPEMHSMFVTWRIHKGILMLISTIEQAFTVIRRSTKVHYCVSNENYRIVQSRQDLPCFKARVVTATTREPGWYHSYARFSPVTVTRTRSTRFDTTLKDFTPWHISCGKALEMFLIQLSVSDFQSYIHP